MDNGHATVPKRSRRNCSRCKPAPEFAAKLAIKLAHKLATKLTPELALKAHALKSRLTL